MLAKIINPAKGGIFVTKSDEKNKTAISVIINTKDTNFLLINIFVFAPIALTIF